MKKNVTVFMNQVEYDVKHPLQNQWTLWFDVPEKSGGDKRGGRKPKPSDNWMDNVQNVNTFGTVEDFWGTYNNTPPCSSLPDRGNFHMFKKDVLPMWEDKANKLGGKWTFKVTKHGVLPAASGGKRIQLGQLWETTLAAMVGELLEDEGDVRGAVVSVRRGADRLSLWTATASNIELQKRIGTKLKQLLGVSAEVKGEFTAHADTIKRESQRGGGESTRDDEDAIKV